MTAKLRQTLITIILVCFAGQAALYSGYIYPKWQKDYSPSTGGLAAAELSPDQILLQLFGFREFLAGILWVRADGFFDEGNYDAILPIIKLCVLLDPKQIDIYATGMWHIGYNFTDEAQRSDRRYIPAALALGKEGSKQNPNTYELFFETGWMWFHKIQDDPWQAVKWFEEAVKRPDMLPARKDLLASAYMRNGEIDKMLTEYYKLYDEAVERSKKDSAYGNTEIRDSLEQNIDTNIVRMVQRGWFAEQRKDGSYETGNYDTKPPFDTGFSCKVTVVSPRVLHFEGTWNVLPVGTRIRLILRDADYPGVRIAELNWDSLSTVDLNPPGDLTYMQDELYVKNRRFNKDIDMSKDITMYPCVKKDYIIEFYYNARNAPPHIQDKFGWNGEGMRDSKFDNTEIRPGVHCMYTTLKLTQDQLLLRGEWSGKTPVIKTDNYKEVDATKNTDEQIKVPSVRGS
jgi:tetratricopeptide (TPR) repeat protein